MYPHYGRNVWHIHGFMQNSYVFESGRRRHFNTIDLQFLAISIDQNDDGMQQFTSTNYRPFLCVYRIDHEQCMLGDILGDEPWVPNYISFTSAGVLLHPLFNFASKDYKHYLNDPFVFQQIFIPSTEGIPFKVFVCHDKIVSA